MKTFTQFCFLVLLCLCGEAAFSQVKIGDNPTNVNPNALLELESSSKGLLLPRLTNDQIAAMTNVPTGMLLFSTTDSALYLRRDTGWAILDFKKEKKADPKWARNGDDIYNTNPGKVGIGTSTPEATLDVKGDVKVSGDVTIDGDVNIKGNMKVDIVDSVTNATLYAGEFKAFYAGCPTGYKLIGGGGGHRDFNYYQKEMVINYSGPDPDHLNRWRVLMTNLTTTDYLQVQVYAICAKMK